MADQFPYFFDEEHDEETNKKVNLEIMKYSGMYILKKMSLSPEEGGHIFEVPLSGMDEHLEPVLDDLLFHDLLEIDAVNTRYKLTREGEQYVDKIIGEIEGYIGKYQDFEPVTRVNLMKRDRVNPLRARFLWGLYDGEFDNLKQWQEDWEVESAEILADWQLYVTKKEFYDELFWDINNIEDLDDDALDEVLQEAEEERQQNMPDIKINRVEGGGQNIQRSRGDDIVVTEHYHHDPYYFNPVYDPLFWYIVF